MVTRGRYRPKPDPNRGGRKTNYLQDCCRWIECRIFRYRGVINLLREGRHIVVLVEQLDGDRCRGGPTGSVRGPIGGDGSEADFCRPLAVQRCAVPHRDGTGVRIDGEAGGTVVTDQRVGDLAVRARVGIPGRNRTDHRSGRCVLHDGHFVLGLIEGRIVVVGVDDVDRYLGGGCELRDARVHHGDVELDGWRLLVIDTGFGADQT